MIKNNNQTEEKEFKLEVEFSPTSVGVQDAEKNGVKLNVQDSIKVAPGTSEKFILKFSFQKTQNSADMRDISISRIKTMKTKHTKFRLRFA